MARPVRAASSAPAGVLHQQISLQPAPTDAPDPADKPTFWELLNTIAPEDWWTGTHGDKGAKVYLYQDLPESRYIAIIKEPFDIEWVRDTYGGGRYRAQLNGPDGRIMSAVRFVIDGEPKKKPPQSETAAYHQPAQADALTSLVEMIREEQRETRAMLREVMSRERSGTVPNAGEIQMQLLPTIVGGVVNMFKDMMPRQADPMELALKLMAVLRPPDMFQVLKDAKAAGLIPDTAGGGNMLEQLSGVMAVADKLGFSQGAGGKSLTEMLIDKGPEILKVFTNGIREYRELEEKRLETAKVAMTLQRQQPAMPAAPQPAAVPPSAPQPGFAPGPATNQPQPGAQPTAVPLQVEPIGAVPPAQAAAEISAQAIDVIKAKIVQAIMQGMTGDDIIGFLNVEAPMVVGGFVGATEAQLVQGFSEDPILHQAAASPRFRTVIKELAEVLAQMVEDQEENPPDQPVSR